MLLVRQNRMICSTRNFGTDKEPPSFYQSSVSEMLLPPQNSRTLSKSSTCDILDRACKTTRRKPTRLFPFHSHQNQPYPQLTLRFHADKRHIFHPRPAVHQQARIRGLELGCQSKNVREVSPLLLPIRQEFQVAK